MEKCRRAARPAGSAESARAGDCGGHGSRRRDAVRAWRAIGASAPPVTAARPRHARGSTSAAAVALGLARSSRGSALGARRRARTRVADAARWRAARGCVSRRRGAGARAAWAPASVLARLPALARARAAARASADWLPPSAPGRGSGSVVAAPPDRATARCASSTRSTPRSRERVFDVLERGHVDLGHVIVMDPATSELLVYASTDVERFPPTATYPAASLIKVVTAAAALDRTPGAARRPAASTGARTG